MSTVNKIILVGNLGKDPETFNFDGGGRITKFSVATSEKYTAKNGEKVNNTEWHNVVTNGKLSELAEKYLKKGSKVYLEGRIKYRMYDSDGIKKYITEIYVREMTFLSSQNGTTSEGGIQNEMPKDDIPF